MRQLFQPAAAEVRETHTGLVFLVGDRAFKAKKPVDFGFCDFTGHAAREAACAREIALNSRLAPDVYLGLAHLQMPGEQQLEPLVVMRRMPDNARLAARVAAGTTSEADLRGIAKLLAAFHDRCDRGPAVDADVTRSALAGKWARNFAQCRIHVDDVLPAEQLDTAQREVARFLAGRGPLFESRITAGRAVDGHGDLLADDIFLLPDGPRILDCLEFDDALRHVDRIDDVAFLAMDLERLGAVGAAATLIRWYRDFSGDQAPMSLVHHYLAYRAVVRAKVSCLRHEQGDPTARAQARSLLASANRHLADGAPRLVLIGGAPGTGKSTLATALGDELGFPTLHTDRIRKELAGIDPDTPAPESYRCGLYDPAHTDRTYGELLARAEALLANGESVVLDASWTAAARREAAADVATRTHSRLVELRCTAPPEVAEARMVGRRGPSDANPTVAAAMRAETDPWPTSHAIDTLCTPTATCREAVALVTAEFAGSEPHLPAAELIGVSS